MRITVYCASSTRADQAYRDAAFHFGQLLGRAGHTLVYGGGSGGSMGAVANGALAAHGEVIGIIPRFLDRREWGHRGISELKIVETMAERKRLLLADSDAVVALPGGCGTMDELFEAITLKRLGRYAGAIVLLDTRGYYQPLAAFLRHVVEERFLAPEFAALWQLVPAPEDVLPAVVAARAQLAPVRRGAAAAP